MNEVSQRTARVRSIFLDTQSFYAEQDDMESLLQWLENTEPAFRSVAYESASMAIALKDLQQENGLHNWLAYTNGIAAVHKAQVYIGLGLAMAQLNYPVFPIPENIDPLFYHRVVDGCGYYDGSFRQRRTVLSQQLPVHIPTPVMHFYDQGLGRSLWYTSGADINKISSWIESFPAGRQPALWRGIGIAVAYVGGSDTGSLKKLLDHAATDAIELAYGAAQASRTRREANALTTDTDECSRFWYNLTAGKENMLATGLTGLDKINNETIYLDWMLQVEERQANSFSINSWSQ